MADHDTQLDTSPTPDGVSPIDDSQLDEATGGTQMIRMSMKCNDCGHTFYLGGNASEVPSTRKCPYCGSIRVSMLRTNRWEFV